MDKIDARKLSPDALMALRCQAMRLRQELGLPWREIARVMDLNTTTVFDWAQRYTTEGKAGLVSSKRGHTYLSGHTLTLAAGMGDSNDPHHASDPDTGLAVCLVKS